ncbi:MAG: alginate export family protein [Novosphingobium sp.]|nr:alginate export family protein [Novosphingobium sp.]MBO9601278.1 alginate export family protein [Novosphingobium sp.]
MTIRFLPLIALALPCAAGAETPSLQSAIGDPSDFKLSASVRLRYETLDGQPRADLPPSDRQLDSRATLFAEYDPGVVRFGAELYDSRAWLNRPGDSLDTTQVNTLELVQAYVAADFDAPFGAGSKAGLQAGRFKLDLGSRRLFADDDFRNTTTGFTGLRANLRTAGGLAATAFYVLPQVRLPDDRAGLAGQSPEWDRESFALQAWGALLARPETLAGATAELGYFGLRERDWAGHPTRNRDLDTFSARVIRDPRPGAIDFELEGFYQSGTIRTGTAPDAPVQAVGAWAMHADAGRLFPGRAKLRLSLEFDRVGGDKAGGRYGRFDTLYGMRRADFGPAGIYNDIGRANIESFGLRAEIAPSPRFDAFATWHALWLAEKTDAFSTTGVRDPTGASGSFAGHQFDLRIRYWLVPKFLRAEANAVWLAKGRFLHDAPNAPDAGNTHYLAGSLTASF